MSVPQVPIDCDVPPGREVHGQCAALCWRIDRGRPRILLTTTRGTGRWILPKGWPIDGLSPAETAAREAWEEAGVQGRSRDLCLGLFSYCKATGSGDMLCVAVVYPVKVKTLSRRFPEKGQRQRKWFSPKKAASRVQEPELARILREFDPGVLG